MTKTVKHSSLALEGVNDIESGDSLSLSVFGVSDGVSDDVFQEHLENTTCFFVDETGDTLYTATTSETTDSRLCDTLEPVRWDFEG